MKWSEVNGTKSKSDKAIYPNFVDWCVGNMLPFSFIFEKKNKNNKLIYFLVIFDGYQNDCILQKKKKKKRERYLVFKKPKILLKLTWN